MIQSEKIDLIAKALCEFQKEVTPAPKDSSNPFFKSKYTDLATLTEHIKPLLTKHGLSYSQVCENAGSVTTILMHTSGQFIGGTLTLNPSKNDPQGIGSAITYNRRYSLGSITGVVTEEDDDGNEASKPTPKKPEPKPEPKPQPKPQPKRELTKEESNTLEAVKQEVEQANTLGKLTDIYTHWEGKKHLISAELLEAITKKLTERKKSLEGK